MEQILRHGSQMEVSPRLAARIVVEARCEYHVPPSNRIVDVLADAIRAGGFQGRRLSFARLDGKLILIRGLACLQGVIRSGIAARFRIRVRPVGSKEELRALALRIPPAAPTQAGVAPAPAEHRPTASAAAPPAAAESEDTPLAQILVHGQDVLITRDLAERIEKECLYERERPLREDRLSLHMADIAAGRFTQGSLMAFGLLDGKLIRVDGRHRTHAVIRSGKAQTFLIAVYPVASMDELAQLYAIFDTPGSVRDPIDAAGHLLAKGKLSKREVRVLLRAVPFIQAGFRLPGLPKSAKMAQSPVARNHAANAFYSSAVAYFSHIGSAPHAIKETLHRQAIAAFGIHTFQHQPRKAAEFWGALATLADEDKGMARTDPRRALYKRLQAREESMPMQLHIVAAAWNAFFEGRKLREIRVRGDNPFRIAGTPIIDVQLEEEHDGAADDSH